MNLILDMVLQELFLPLLFLSNLKKFLKSHFKNFFSIILEKIIKVNPLNLHQLREQKKRF